MSWSTILLILLGAGVVYFFWLKNQRQEEGDFNPEISYELVKKGALLIDVRSEGEYVSGHIEGAFHIPHTQIMQNKERIKSLVKGDMSKPVVVYCASGRRSGMAKEQLKQLGHEIVVNHGGYSSWKK